MATRDWIKLEKNCYISKQKHESLNPHYLKDKYGPSKLTITKLDRNYYVTKMVAGIIEESNIFTNKRKAHVHLI